jgi:ATP-dependent Clp protease ATP-binding subunit ClpC
MLVDEEVGFNISKMFEDITFNVISRCIGAVVRTFLIIFCLMAIAGYFFAGLLLLIIWFVFPPVDLGSYLDYQRSLSKFINDLVTSVKNHPDVAVNLIFKNQAGNYLFSHLGVDISVLIPELKVDPVSLGNLKAESYKEIIGWLLAANPDFEPKLRKLSLANADLLLAAECWDYLKSSQSKRLNPDTSFDYPGIGAELLTGYTPHLNNYSESYNVKQSFSNHLVGRADIVSRLARVLQGGKSVLLIGQPGVGKKTVIHEFVHRASKGEMDQSLSYARVLELNYQAILSESNDLNMKKVKLSQLIREASSAGNVILVIKDLQRLTNADFEGVDFTDVISQALDGGNLKIIAVSSTVDYERFLAKDARIGKYFEAIEVVPPSKDEALTLLIAFAQQLEAKKKTIITSPALRRILDGSERYITDTPFPEKTLELLDEVVTERLGSPSILVDDVNKILSEKTGISMARLTEQEQAKLANLEDIIHQNLINQSAAVTLIAQSLRGRTLGIKSEERPIGSFLFLGPTGVGKTQTAKVLADVYFGDKNNIVRFDMAEYVGPEGVARLIGSVERNQPGALTTAIKNHPACLLLLDEMEKCPKEIFNFFLTMLDEGYMNDASGKRINCRYLFVIATSNAGSEFIRESVAGGMNGEKLQQSVVDHIQKQGYFSPEFLNRFDGVVVYEPLSPENLLKVADLQLKDLKKSLLAKNIELTYGEDLCQKLATEGYDPAFGARPMRRIIDLTISDLLSKSLLGNEIVDGDKITLTPGPAPGEYHWHKSI